MERIINTWKRRGIRVKMHISSQGEGKIGHHSEYIEEIPEYVIEIKEGIDLMVEAKRKEKAIKRLKERYGGRVGGESK